MSPSKGTLSLRLSLILLAFISVCNEWWQLNEAAPTAGIHQSNSNTRLPSDSLWRQPEEEAASKLKLKTRSDFANLHHEQQQLLESLSPTQGAALGRAMQAMSDNHDVRLIPGLRRLKRQRRRQRVIRQSNERAEENINEASFDQLTTEASSEHETTEGTFSDNNFDNKLIDTITSSLGENSNLKKVTSDTDSSASAFDSGANEPDYGDDNLLELGHELFVYTPTGDEIAPPDSVAAAAESDAAIDTDIRDETSNDDLAHLVPPSETLSIWSPIQAAPEPLTGEGGGGLDAYSIGNPLQKDSAPLSATNIDISSKNNTNGTLASIAASPFRPTNLTLQTNSSGRASPVLPAGGGSPSEVVSNVTLARSTSSSSSSSSSPPSSSKATADVARSQVSSMPGTAGVLNATTEPSPKVLAGPEVAPAAPPKLPVAPGASQAKSGQEEQQSMRRPDAEYKPPPELAGGGAIIEPESGTPGHNRIRPHERPYCIGHTDSQSTFIWACQGFQLIRMPVDLEPSPMSLHLLNTGIERLVQGSLSNYRDTLRDFSIDNAPRLLTVEPGFFADLTKLRVVYIFKAPKLHSFDFAVLGRHPDLTIVRIQQTSLRRWPDLSRFRQERILTSVDLDYNYISSLGSRPINLRCELLNLEFNKLTSIEEQTFNGSEIGVLSLRANRQLSFIHPNAFANLRNLIKLDLSSTSVSQLPTVGLRQLRSLIIRDNYALKRIPSIYVFPMLEEAHLTYAYHCCSFRYPQTHDPSAHEEHMMLQEEINALCASQGARQSFHPMSAGSPLGVRVTDNLDLPDQVLQNLQHRQQHAHQGQPQQGQNSDFEGYFEEEQKVVAPSGIKIDPSQQQSMAGTMPAGSNYKTAAHEATGPNDSPSISQNLSIGQVDKPSGHSSTPGGFLDGTISHSSLTKLLLMQNVECGELVKYGAYPNISCTPEPDAFNPCEDIMGYSVLRVAVWFVVGASVFGNLSVIVVLCGVFRRLSVPKLLQLNLAIGDLFMGVYLAMLATADLTTVGVYFNYAIDWQHGYGCKIAGAVSLFASQLSIFSLSVITFERYYTITYSIDLNMRLQLGWAVRIMFLGWLYAFASAMLPIFANINSYSKTSICLPMRTAFLSDKIFILILLIIDSSAFVIIFACYLRMYLLIIRQKTQATAKERTVAKRMALLVSTDFACWAPIIFFGTTALFGWPLISVTNSKILIVFFYPLNSMANPFLYVISTRQYRRDLSYLTSRWRSWRKSLFKRNHLTDSFYSAAYGAAHFPPGGLNAHLGAVAAVTGVASHLRHNRLGPIDSGGEQSGSAGTIAVAAAAAALNDLPERSGAAAFIKMHEQRVVCSKAHQGQYVIRHQILTGDRHTLSLAGERSRRPAGRLRQAPSKATTLATNSRPSNSVKVAALNVDTPTAPSSDQTLPVQGNNSPVTIHRHQNLRRQHACCAHESKCVPETGPHCCHRGVAPSVRWTVGSQRTSLDEHMKLTNVSSGGQADDESGDVGAFGSNVGLTGTKCGPAEQRASGSRNKMARFSPNQHTGANEAHCEPPASTQKTTASSGTRGASGVGCDSGCAYPCGTASIACASEGRVAYRCCSVCYTCCPFGSRATRRARPAKWSSEEARLGEAEPGAEQEAGQEVGSQSACPSKVMTSVMLLADSDMDKAQGGSNIAESAGNLSGKEPTSSVSGVSSLIVSGPPEGRQGSSRVVESSCRCGIKSSPDRAVSLAHNRRRTHQCRQCSYPADLRPYVCTSADGVFNETSDPSTNLSIEHELTASGESREHHDEQRPSTSSKGKAATLSSHHRHHCRRCAHRCSRIRHDHNSHRHHHRRQRHHHHHHHHHHHRQRDAAEGQRERRTSRGLPGSSTSFQEVIATSTKMRKHSLQNTIAAFELTGEGGERGAGAAMRPSQASLGGEESSDLRQRSQSSGLASTGEPARPLESILKPARDQAKRAPVRRSYLLGGLLRSGGSLKAACTFSGARLRRRAFNSLREASSQTSNTGKEKKRVSIMEHHSG